MTATPSPAYMSPIARLKRTVLFPEPDFPTIQTWRSRSSRENTTPPPCAVVAIGKGCGGSITSRQPPVKTRAASTSPNLPSCALPYLWRSGLTRHAERPLVRCSRRTTRDRRHAVRRGDFSLLLRFMHEDFAIVELRVDTVARICAPQRHSPWWDTGCIPLGADANTRARRGRRSSPDAERPPQRG